METACGSYRHDQPHDRLWRRYGHWAYVAVCMVVPAAVSARATAPSGLVESLSPLPALRGLFEHSSADARIAAWLLASFCAYPLLHMGMRSRIYQQPHGPYWKGGLAVVVLNVVLLGALGFDLMALHGSRHAVAMRDAMASGGAAFLLVAPMLSLAYGFVLFVNIHFFNMLSQRVAKTP